ncbi:hypothetical protein Thiowin_02693 [Thiorhodovibrio winogradskyi]|uniref:Sulfotransferase family protein n=1 Tax=Thiorhodovibrio winogradskyi TaxID=77007 RepID=A0ABZ0SAI0_9GAMM|nr:hypothetical protein [Thiorhodovibrio winogradskyi]
MAVYSRTYKFVYFQNPRTGSTMLETVLIKELGGELIPIPKNHAEKMRYKHLTYFELLGTGVISRRELDSMFLFTSVRNPYDKAVSDWQGEKKFYQKSRTPEKRPENVLAHRTTNLEDYLKLVLLLRLPLRLRFAIYRYLPVIAFNFLAALYGFGRRMNRNSFTIDKMNLYIRNKNIESDFQEFLSKIGVNRVVKLPIINRTENRTQDYESYQTVNTRRWLRKMYSDIFDRFYPDLE